MEIIRTVGEKGQVVIPIDIRRMLKLKEGEKIVFEIKDNKITVKKQQSSKEWLKEFLKYRKKGKSLTHEEIDKIYEESYDLP